jgi:hypothetical protein
MFRCAAPFNDTLFITIAYRVTSTLRKTRRVKLSVVTSVGMEKADLKVYISAQEQNHEPFQLIDSLLIL